MKKISCIAALLLGLAFVYFGLSFFIPAIAPSTKPTHSPEAMSMIGAMYQSGYLSFVKVLEITGGVLLLLPRVRAWGLLIIGPILLNILAIHVFLDKDYTNVLVLGLSALALVVAYGARKGFCCLACCGSGCCGDSCCGSDGKSEGGCCGSEKEKSSGCCGDKK